MEKHGRAEEEREKKERRKTPRVGKVFHQQRCSMFMAAGNIMELQRGDGLKKYILRWLTGLFLASMTRSIVLIWIASVGMSGNRATRAIIIFFSVMNILFFTPGIMLFIYKMEFHGFSRFEYNHYQMEFISPPNLLRPRTIVYCVAYGDITRIFLDFNCSYAIILRDNSRFEVPLKVIASQRNEMMFLESMNLLYQFHQSQYGSRIFFDPPTHLYSNDVLAKSMRGKPGRVFFEFR